MRGKVEGKRRKVASKVEGKRRKVASKGVSMKARPAQQVPTRAGARANASPVHDVIDDICAKVASGLPMASAAWACGVTPEMLASRVDSQPDVAARVEAARVQSEAHHLAVLEALIEEGKPTAGQVWKMERLFRRDWHLTQKVALDVAQLQPTAEQLERALEVRRKREALEAGES